MVVVLVLGASGILAACTRPLTAVALASTVAVPRKLLREIIVVSLFNVRRSHRRIPPWGFLVPAYCPTCPRRTPRPLGQRWPARSRASPPSRERSPQCAAPPPQ